VVYGKKPAAKCLRQPLPSALDIVSISHNWIVPVRNFSVLLPFTATLSRLCDCGCHIFVRPVWFLRTASFEIVNRICFVITVRF
jgi:hypothetical protein